jgi:hypothetical protein
MMLGHHFVGQYLYLRTKLQHAALLIDECPPDGCFLDYGIGSIVRKCAEQWLS